MWLTTLCFSPPASQPALEEADMHKGAGAQPVCTPHGGVANPPCLDDATTSCHSANGAGVNPEQRCSLSFTVETAPFWSATGHGKGGQGARG